MQFIRSDVIKIENNCAFRNYFSKLVFTFVSVIHFKTELKMKKVNFKLRSMAIVAVILSVVAILPVSAQQLTNIQVIPAQNKKMIFHASGLNTQSRFQIKIQDDQGNLLYSETFKNKQDYKKILDFSFAQQGDYYIDLLNEKGLFRKIVNISEDSASDSNVLFDVAATAEFNKSVQKVDDKKYAFRFKNELESPVNFKIYDQQGHIIHEELEITEEDFAKLFDLSKLAAGNYSFAVTAKNYTYFYDVNLDY